MRKRKKVCLNSFYLWGKGMEEQVVSRQYTRVAWYSESSRKKEKERESVLSACERRDAVRRYKI